MEFENGIEMFFRKHRHKNKIKVWDGDLSTVFPDDDIPVRVKASKKKNKKKWKSFFDYELSSEQKEEIVCELMLRPVLQVRVKI